MKTIVRKAIALILATILIVSPVLANDYLIFEDEVMSTEVTEAFEDYDSASADYSSSSGEEDYSSGEEDYSSGEYSFEDEDYAFEDENETADDAVSFNDDGYYYDDAIGEDTQNIAQDESLLNEDYGSDDVYMGDDSYIIEDETIDDSVATEGESFTGEQVTDGVSGSVSVESTVSNDDLFAEYVDQMFGISQPSPKKRRTSTTSKLTDAESNIYNILAGYIQEVAAGTRESTEFEVSVESIYGTNTWTASELGVDSIFNSAGSVSQEVQDAFIEQLFSFDLSLVRTALLEDFPYHMYWMDKTRGISYQSSSIWYYPEYVTVETITFRMYVAEAYSGGGDFVVNTSIGEAVDHAVEKAASIVAGHENESDLEKLQGYKDDICNLVSYNYDALGANVPYGNPWQLIWVFDENTNTNVVCEGYSKAFKYLCDQSSFNDNNIRCLTVYGNMNGGAHMWNVVRMEDDNNYLVDVTNCDRETTGEQVTEMIGYPNYLFLAGANEQSFNEDNRSTGYLISFEKYGYERNVSYTYNGDMFNLFSDPDLRLNSLSYNDQHANDQSIEISASDYNGTYDKEPHTITVAAEEGATVTYSESLDGPYTDTNPSYTDVGTYTVFYKVTKDLLEEYGSKTVMINPRYITIYGITGVDKPYDGDTTATLDFSGVVYGGIIEGDTLSVTAIGTFADANPGEDKVVTISNLTLEGNTNYQLASSGQQTETTASIIETNPTILKYVVYSEDDSIAYQSDILDEAWEYANNNQGSMLKLYDDAKGRTAALDATGSFTVDLNGFEIESSSAAFVVSGNLHIVSTGNQGRIKSTTSDGIIVNESGSTALEVTNASIFGADRSIMLNGGSLLLTGCALTGATTGFQTDGGTVTFGDCTVSGTIDVWSVNYGTTTIGLNNTALESNSVDGVKIRIHEGEAGEQISAFPNVYSDQMYELNDEFVWEDTTGDYPYVVGHREAATVSIDGITKGFDTLDDAWAYANTYGGVLTMGADSLGRTDTLVANRAFTLDLNGYTITNTNETNDGSFQDTFAFEGTEGTFVITSSSGNRGTIRSTNGFGVVNNAKNNAKLEVIDTLVWGNSAALLQNSGQLEVIESELTGNVNGYMLNGGSAITGGGVIQGGDGPAISITSATSLLTIRNTDLWAGIGDSIYDDPVIEVPDFEGDTFPQIRSEKAYSISDAYAWLKEDVQENPYKVVRNNSPFTVTYEGITEVFNDFTSAWVYAGETLGTLTMNESVVVEEPLIALNEFTLDLNGHTIANNNVSTGETVPCETLIIKEDFRITSSRPDGAITSQNGVAIIIDGDNSPEVYIEGIAISGNEEGFVQENGDLDLRESVIDGARRGFVTKGESAIIGGTSITGHDGPAITINKEDAVLTLRNTQLTTIVPEDVHDVPDIEVPDFEGEIFPLIRSEKVYPISGAYAWIYEEGQQDPYKVVRNSSSFTVTTDGATEAFSDFESAWARACETHGTLTMNESLVVSEPLLALTSFTLDLNGHEISNYNVSTGETVPCDTLIIKDNFVVTSSRPEGAVISQNGAAIIIDGDNNSPSVKLEGIAISGNDVALVQENGVLDLRESVIDGARRGFDLKNASAIVGGTSITGHDGPAIMVTEASAALTLRHTQLTTLVPDGFSNIEVLDFEGDTYPLIRGEDTYPISDAYAWIYEEGQQDPYKVVRNDGSFNFTVTFDTYGGTPDSIPSQSVNFGGKATKPQDPEKEGYLFGGWYNNGTLFDFSHGITSDVELRASWWDEASAGPATVTSADEFLTAMVNPGCETITLGQNITLDTLVLVNKAVYLDLNGYTLASSVGFVIKDTYRMCIRSSQAGGTIHHTGSDYGFTVENGGTLLLESGTLTSANPIIHVVKGEFHMTGGAVRRQGTTNAEAIRLDDPTYRDYEYNSTIKGGVIENNNGPCILCGMIVLNLDGNASLTSTGDSAIKYDLNTPNYEDWYADVAVHGETQITSTTHAAVDGTGGGVRFFGGIMTGSPAVSANTRFIFRGGTFKGDVILNKTADKGENDIFGGYFDDAVTITSDKPIIRGGHFKNRPDDSYIDSNYILNSDGTDGYPYYVTEKPDEGPIHVSTAGQLLDAISNGKGRLVLDADITLDSQINATGFYLNLNLNGHLLKIETQGETCGIVGGDDYIEIHDDSSDHNGSYEYTGSEFAIQCKRLMITDCAIVNTSGKACVLVTDGFHLNNSALFNNNSDDPMSCCLITEGGESGIDDGSILSSTGTCLKANEGIIHISGILDSGDTEATALEIGAAGVHFLDGSITNQIGAGIVIGGPGNLLFGMDGTSSEGDYGCSGHPTITTTNGPGLVVNHESGTATISHNAEIQASIDAIDALAGSVSIYNGQFEGTPAFHVGNANVAIKGGTFDSPDKCALIENGNCTISGGFFSSVNSLIEGDVTGIVSGGYFNKPIAQKYIVNANCMANTTGLHKEYGYTIGTTAIAFVDGIGYEYFEDAVEAADGERVITLLFDVGAYTLRGNESLIIEDGDGLIDVQAAPGFRLQTSGTNPVTYSQVAYTCTVVFQDEEGNLVDTKEIAANTTAPRPSDPTKEGFAFAGWFEVIDGTLAQAAFDFATPVTNDITLRQKWASSTVTVTFDDGTNITTQEVELGGYATIPAVDPVKDGYVFIEWVVDGVPFNFDTQISEPVTLEASWQREWTVTFVSEGETIKTEKVLDGENVTPPSRNPVRDELSVFQDWVDEGGRTFDFENRITTDHITLTARFKPYVAYIQYGDEYHYFTTFGDASAEAWENRNDLDGPRKIHLLTDVTYRMSLGEIVNVDQGGYEFICEPKFPEIHIIVERLSGYICDFKGTELVRISIKEISDKNISLDSMNITDETKEIAAGDDQTGGTLEISFDGGVTDGDTAQPVFEINPTVKMNGNDVSETVMPDNDFGDTTFTFRLYLDSRYFAAGDMVNISHDHNDEIMQWIASVESDEEGKPFVAVTLSKFSTTTVSLMDCVAYTTTEVQRDDYVEEGEVWCSSLQGALFAGNAINKDYVDVNVLRDLTSIIDFWGNEPEGGMVPGNVYGLLVKKPDEYEGDHFTVNLNLNNHTITLEHNCNWGVSVLPGVTLVCDEELPFVVLEIDDGAHSPFIYPDTESIPGKYVYAGEIPDEVEITINAGDGTYDGEQTGTVNGYKGEKLSRLLDPALIEANNKEFAYWSTDENGEEGFDPEEFILENNVTIYAQYRETIHFDGDIFFEDEEESAHIFNDGDYELRVDLGWLSEEDGIQVVWTFGHADDNGVFYNTIGENAGVYSLDDSGRVATVNGVELVSHLKEGTDGINVRVRVLKGDEQLADRWLWLRVYEAVEDYRFPIEDWYALPGWGHGFGKEITCYVKNGAHPDGEEVGGARITRMEVTVVEGEKGAVTVDELDDGYHIQANSFGHAHVSLFYDRYNGEPAAEPYVFDVWVSDGAWEMWIQSDPSTNMVLPGHSITLDAGIVHHRYDPVEDRHYDDENSAVEYDWYTEEQTEERFDWERDNEDPSVIHVTAHADLENGLDGLFEVRAYLLNEDGNREKDEAGNDIEVGCAEFTLECFNEYYVLYPDELPDKELMIGGTMEVDPHVMKYTLDEDGNQQEEDVTDRAKFRWEWAVKAIEITDAEEKVLSYEDDTSTYGKAPFTIRRNLNWITDIWLIAEWEENGDEIYHRVMRLNEAKIIKNVTFKVVNGSWDDGSKADVVVTLTGHEGDELKLTEEQIPAVGKNPGSSFGAGSWDVEPSIETAITEDTTYTFTYKKNIKITVPKEKTLTYNGKEQALISAVKASPGKVEYALEDGEWSTTIPTGKDAGQYIVRYRATAAGYNDAEGKLEPEIKQKDVTISGIKANDKYYNEDIDVELDCDVAKINGKVAGDDLFVTATGEFDTPDVGKNKNVTIRELTLQGNSAANYNLPDKGKQTKATASILAKPMEVRVEGYREPYDGEVHGISVNTKEVNAIINYATAAKGPYTSENPSYKDAGKYTVYYKVEKTGYNTVSGSAIVEITKRDVTVSGITADSKEYDGKTTATLKYDDAVFTGKLAEDNLTVTATGTFDSASAGDNKDVIISKLTLGGDSVKNYQLASSGQQETAKANISRKRMEVSVSPYTGVYDKKDHSISVTTKEKGAKIEYAWSEEGPYSTAKLTKRDVGVYPVFYKVTKTDCETEEGSANITIEKKEVKVSGITALNKPEDGTKDAVLDCSKAKFTGIVSGDKLTVTATGQFSETGVGKNIIVEISGWKLGGESVGNYKLATDGNQTEAKANITLHEYKINYYNVDDASNPNPTSCTAATKTFKLKNPTKAGYEFLGWTEKEDDPAVSATTDVTITNGVDKDLNYYAHWKANTYTITCNLNGGIVDDPKWTEPVEYTPDNPVSLPNPTLPGGKYNFAGWTGTGLTAAETDYVVRKGSYGNLTYTATWTEADVTTEHYILLVGGKEVITLGEEWKTGKATSDNTAIATAAFKNGVLTVTGKKPGEATVKVLPNPANGSRRDYVIHVVAKPTATINLAKVTKYICEGPFELSVDVNVGKVKSVVYSSSKASVAEVDKDTGEVTPKSAGAANITAVVNIEVGPEAVLTGEELEELSQDELNEIKPTTMSQSVKCTVTVKAPTLKLSSTKLSLTKGETKTITVTAVPAPTTVGDVIITTDGKEYTTQEVIENGTKIKITGGNQSGTETITVTVNGVSKILTLTVK